MILQHRDDSAFMPTGNEDFCLRDGSESVNSRAQSMAVAAA